MLARYEPQQSLNLSPDYFIAVLVFLSNNNFNGKYAFENF